MKTSTKGTELAPLNQLKTPHLATDLASYLSSIFADPVPKDITKNRPNSDAFMELKSEDPLVISFVTSLMAIRV